jgi:hypothetical protein
MSGTPETAWLNLILSPTLVWDMMSFHLRPEVKKMWKNKVLGFQEITHSSTKSDSITSQKPIIIFLT